MIAVADELTTIVDRAADRLARVPAERTTARPAEDAWSAQEILGHLLDSAANNHQRFVRAQQSSELQFPGYQQDDWVSANGYRDANWLELVQFWRLYNHHLARVIRRIPAAALDTPCQIGTGPPMPLRFLVEDYVVHLRHHLSQIDEQLSD
jgi:hypothetical protein